MNSVGVRLSNGEISLSAGLGRVSILRNGILHRGNHVLIPNWEGLEADSQSMTDHRHQDTAYYRNFTKNTTNDSAIAVHPLLGIASFVYQADIQRAVFVILFLFLFPQRLLLR